jgi:hypothetical protein
MDSISGERRADRRYGVQLNVRYRLVRTSRLLAEGTGTTCNMSKGGVSFSPDRILPAKASVELSIEWPSLLHGEHPLELHIVGRVVRSLSGETAIRTMWHAFVRVNGARHDAVVAEAMPADSAVLVM